MNNWIKQTNSKKTSNKINECGERKWGRSENIASENSSLNEIQISKIKRMSELLSSAAFISAIAFARLQSHTHTHIHARAPARTYELIECINFYWPFCRCLIVYGTTNSHSYINITQTYTYKYIYVHITIAIWILWRSHSELCADFFSIDSFNYSEKCERTRQWARLSEWVSERFVFTMCVLKPKLESIQQKRTSQYGLSTLFHFNTFFFYSRSFSHIFSISECVCVNDRWDWGN